LLQNSTLIAGEDDFVVGGVNESINFIVTNPEGNLFLRGFLNENQSLLVPTPDSFVVQTVDNRVLAYVNSTGSLFLTGSLTENALI
jgi:hypothetical protein